jgi:hypothetical protein
MWYTYFHFMFYNFKFLKKCIDFVYKKKLSKLRYKGIYSRLTVIYYTWQNCFQNLTTRIHCDIHTFVQQYDL